MGIIIFAIVLFAAISMFYRLTGSDNVDVSDAKNLFVEHLSSVASLPSGSKELFLDIQLPSHSAIVGFNAKKDFQVSFDGFNLFGSKLDKNEFYDSALLSYKGVYVKRPAVCNSQTSCVCSCNDVGFQGFDDEEVLLSMLPAGELICSSDWDCVSTNKFSFPEKQSLNEVFSDDLSILPPTFDGDVSEYDEGRDKQFWQDGLILLNSPDIQAGNFVNFGSSVIQDYRYQYVAGYRDYVPAGGVFEFSLASRGNGEVSICFERYCD